MNPWLGLIITCTALMRIEASLAESTSEFQQVPREPLFFRCISDHDLGCIRFLVEEGRIDVNAVDPESGRSALATLSRSRHYTLERSRVEEIIQLLTSRGGKELRQFSGGRYIRARPLHLGMFSQDALWRPGRWSFGVSTPLLSIELHPYDLNAYPFLGIYWSGVSAAPRLSTGLRLGNELLHFSAGYFQETHLWSDRGAVFETGLGNLAISTGLSFEQGTRHRSLGFFVRAPIVQGLIFAGGYKPR